MRRLATAYDPQTKSIYCFSGGSTLYAFNTVDKTWKMYQRDKGWTDLLPSSKIFPGYCDSHGMVYDSKRDRMIFTGVGGGYAKKSQGGLLAYDFASGTLSVIQPENAVLNQTGCAREQAYVEHADCVRDRGTKEPAMTEAKEVRAALRERGLLVGIGGAFGNVIRFQSPLSITPDECDRAADLLEEVMLARWTK